ncbi:MAG TPA: hypothetical protein VMB74_15675 [Streptosporangiaceae bacterium]|nr:hypothetical protein [Streptosporangiaceae bacterium]
MKLSSRRARLLGGVVAGCAVAAALVTSAASAATTAAPAARSVVLVNCAGTGQVRPHGYILTCADAGDSLTGLHWVSWAHVAYGSGTEHIHDCYPYCAASKKYYNYPVLIVLWRAEAWPGHAGQKYFTRLTEIRTGSLVLPHFHDLARTMTWDLSADGG